MGNVNKVTETIQDFVYMYTLGVISWAIMLALTVIASGQRPSLQLYMSQWFMLVIIAVIVALILPFYQWSKHNLP